MKRFLTAWKAFLSNPLKFLIDPANVIIDYQVVEMQAQGATMAEIDQSLSEAGLIKGPGPLKVVFDGAVQTIGFVQKNLAAIVLVAVILVIAYFTLSFMRLAKT